MSDALDTALDVAAVARLTELVIADEIARPLVDALIRARYRHAGLSTREADMARMMGWRSYASADPKAPWLAKLITCPWCVSVWIGAGVVAARRVAPGLWAPLARLLAASQAAGMLHEARRHTP